MSTQIASVHAISPAVVHQAEIAMYVKLARRSRSKGTKNKGVRHRQRR